MSQVVQDFFHQENVFLFLGGEKNPDPHNLPGSWQKKATSLAGLNSERTLIGGYLVVGEQPIPRKQKKTEDFRSPG